MSSPNPAATDGRRPWRPLALGTVRFAGSQQEPVMSPPVYGALSPGAWLFRSKVTAPMATPSCNRCACSPAGLAETTGPQTSAHLLSSPNRSRPLGSRRLRLRPLRLAAGIAPAPRVLNQALPSSDIGEAVVRDGRDRGCQARGGGRPHIPLSGGSQPPWRDPVSCFSHPSRAAMG